MAVEKRGGRDIRPENSLNRWRLMENGRYPRGIVPRYIDHVGRAR